MIDIFAVIFGVVLTFLIVVVVHELGHFFAARWVGVKPEIFSVGFGKSIWSRTDRQGTVWQIARIPAGGYVRFVGDENAASLSATPEGPVIPGSLKAATKPAQAFVAVAGPMANVVFTILALSVLPLMSGVTAYPWTIDDLSRSAQTSGLADGDQILAVGDMDIAAQDTLAGLLMRLPDNSEVFYRIARDGSEIVIPAPRPDLPVLGNVAPGSAADDAGLRIGDRLVSIDGAMPLIRQS